MAKSIKRSKARELRKEGMSIKSIAKKLKVSVSSVSNWCRDVELTEAQLLKLSQHARDPLYGNRSTYISMIKEKTNKKVELLRKKGIKKVGKMSKRDLFLVGVSLYWAEGFKKDSQAGFANSDPKMINLFLKWLYECFGYTNEDMLPRVTLNISHKDRIDVVQKYWSDSTKIPIENFKKPFFQNFQWKKTYENSDEYFGVLRIKIRKSKDFLREIHGFIDGLRLQA